MRKQLKVEIQINHVVPQFAKTRVEDFLNAWNPNFMPFKNFVTSLYLQGLSDGFAVGEGFTTSKLSRIGLRSGEIV